MASQCGAKVCGYKKNKDSRGYWWKRWTAQRKKNKQNVISRIISSSREKERLLLISPGGGLQLLRRHDVSSVRHRGNAPQFSPFAITQMSNVVCARDAHLFRKCPAPSSAWCPASAGRWRTTSSRRPRRNPYTEIPTSTKQSLWEVAPPDWPDNVQNRPTKNKQKKYGCQEEVQFVWAEIWCTTLSKGYRLYRL